MVLQLRSSVWDFVDRMNWLTEAINAKKPARITILICTVLQANIIINITDTRPANHVNHTPIIDAMSVTQARI